VYSLKYLWFLFVEQQSQALLKSEIAYIALEGNVSPWLSKINVFIKNSQNVQN